MFRVCQASASSLVYGFRVLGFRVYGSLNGLGLVGRRVHGSKGVGFRVGVCDGFCFV